MYRHAHVMNMEKKRERKKRKHIAFELFTFSSLLLCNYSFWTGEINNVMYWGNIKQSFVF